MSRVCLCELHASGCSMTRSRVRVEKELKLEKDFEEFMAGRWKCIMLYHENATGRVRASDIGLVVRLKTDRQSGMHAAEFLRDMWLTEMFLADHHTESKGPLQLSSVDLECKVR